LAEPYRKPDIVLETYFAAASRDAVRYNPLLGQQADTKIGTKGLKTRFSKIGGV